MAGAATGAATTRVRPPVLAPSRDLLNSQTELWFESCATSVPATTKKHDRSSRNDRQSSAAREVDFLAQVEVQLRGSVWRYPRLVDFGQVCPLGQPPNRVGGGRYGKLESWSVGVVACGGKVAPPGATAWGGMHGRLESWSVGVVRTPEADKE